MIIYTANLSRDYWDTLLNNKPKDSDMSTHQQYAHFTDVLYRFMSVNTPKPDSVNNVQSMIHYLYLLSVSCICHPISKLLKYYQKKKKKKKLKHCQKYSECSKLRYNWIWTFFLQRTLFSISSSSKYSQVLLSSFTQLYLPVLKGSGNIQSICAQILPLEKLESTYLSHSYSFSN